MLKRPLPKVHALTLYPEWVWAIYHLDKRVENRSWLPPRDVMGKKILIHAGAKRSVDALNSMVNMACRAGWEATSNTDSNGIVFRKAGRVEHLPLLPGDRGLIPRSLSGVIYGSVEILEPCRAAVKEARKQSKVWGWAAPDLKHWWLTDPRLILVPIPAKGKQRLWTVPDSIVLQTLEVMGGLD